MALPGSPPGLPVQELESYLQRSLSGMLSGPLSATLLGVVGGRSKLTYQLSDGERRWVLRRPPLGHVLATAHDMTREHRLRRTACWQAAWTPWTGCRRRSG